MLQGVVLGGMDDKEEQDGVAAEQDDGDYQTVHAPVILALKVGGC